MVWFIIFIIVAALAWLFTLPAEMKVARSIELACSPQTAFDDLRNYKQTVAWSPWLLHDPKAEVTYDGDPSAIGSSYHWKSSLIGEGRLVHREQVPCTRIGLDLSFIKPFKSEAKVNYLIDALGDNRCRVTWDMVSRMAIFMRPMRAMMEQMIGRDFELGLAMLAPRFDANAEHPVITFHEVVERSAVPVATLAYAGSLEAMGAAMQKGYPELTAQVGTARQSTPNSPMLALYHQVNMRKNTVVCDMALPINAGQAIGTAIEKTVPSGRYYHVRLQGSYRFLPNAWTAAMGHVRMLKLKVDKSRPSIEEYTIDPSQVKSTNEVVTELYIPVR